MRTLGLDGRCPQPARFWAGSGCVLDPWIGQEGGLSVSADLIPIPCVGVYKSGLVRSGWTVYVFSVSRVKIWSVRELGPGMTDLLCIFSIYIGYSLFLLSPSCLPVRQRPEIREGVR